MLSHKKLLVHYSCTLLFCFMYLYLPTSFFFFCSSPIYCGLKRYCDKKSILFFVKMHNCHQMRGIPSFAQSIEQAGQLSCSTTSLYSESIFNKSNNGLQISTKEKIHPCKKCHAKRCLHLRKTPVPYVSVAKRRKKLSIRGQ